MSKRKFKKGAQVVSIAEIPEHDWFIVLLGRNGKTMHREVLRSWSIRTCEQFIDHGLCSSPSGSQTGSSTRV